jgi:hypothetical protein
MTLSVGRTRAIEKAVKNLLDSQIQQWSEARMTVGARQLLALRDAYRPPGDMGANDAYPLRTMVEARAKQQKPCPEPGGGVK